jgi:hypothetical protein
MLAVLLAVLVAVAALGLVGCSEDNGPSAVVQRYCDLVARFKTPTFPPDADPGVFQEVMVKYVEENHDYFEELIDAAPSEIKKDVENAVVTLRRVASGELEAFDKLDTRKADEFEEKNC